MALPKLSDCNTMAFRFGGFRRYGLRSWHRHTNKQADNRQTGSTAPWNWFMDRPESNEAATTVTTKTSMSFIRRSSLLGITNTQSLAKSATTWQNRM